MGRKKKGKGLIAVDTEPELPQDSVLRRARVLGNPALEGNFYHVMSRETGVSVQSLKERNWIRTPPPGEATISPAAWRDFGAISCAPAFAVADSHWRRFACRASALSIPDPAADGSRYLQTLENLNFIKGRHVTVVGLLLFGKNLPVLLPEMKIDAIWFKGIEKSSDEWRDQRQITGPLSDQFDQGMGFLRKWMSRIQTDERFNNPGRQEVPEVVFDELLTNALIHRDYFIKDSIKLFIFDGRVEIRSPGKLPNNLTVEQIRRGIRRSRNALLASFAPDLLNYRGVGSGVVRALRRWPNIEWTNDIEAEEVTAYIKLDSKGLKLVAAGGRL